MIQRRKKWFKTITFLFFILFSVWVLLQFLAPIALPSESVTDLSGFVAISDNEASTQKMGFPWNAIYTAGDRLCHQQASRSFFLNGNQMPFCARCTAIWLGFAIGLYFLLFYKIDLTERLLVVILIGLVPIGIDGIGQLFGFWESTNLVRFITGLLAGIVSGIAIGVIIDEITVSLELKRKR